MANFLRINSFKVKQTSTITRVPQTKFNVFIEGNIAAGKSTMIEFFSNFPNFEAVPEPIAQWKNLNGHNIFEMMANNPHQNAFKFQSYVLLTMVKEYLRHQNTPIRILERSIFSQRCFTQNLNKSGILDDSSYAILNEWSKFSIDTFNISADAIIYIRTDPEILLQRIHSRGRPEEKNIKLEFLNEIHRYHEQWLLSNAFNRGKLLIINGNSPLIDVENEYGYCLEFLNSLLE